MADWKEIVQDFLDNGHSRANYLINFSEKYRYIFVETPKVGCTTIKKVLQIAEVEGDISSLPESVHDRLNSPIKRVSEAPDEFDGLLSRGDTFKFCFVRNPFTRALSCYLDKIVTNEWERRRLAPLLNFDPDVIPEFSEFLHAVRKQSQEFRDIHWSTQTYLLQPNRVKYSYIGRFEFFSAQFERVCEYLNITEFANVSGAKHATGADKRKGEFFGKAEIELINEIYDQDFRNFGYGRSPHLL